MINLYNNKITTNKRKLYFLLTISFLTLTNIPNIILSYDNDVQATNSNKSFNRQYRDQSQLSISQELKIDLLQEKDFEDKDNHSYSVNIYELDLTTKELSDSQDKNTYNKTYRYTHDRRNIKGFQEHHIISNKNKAIRNHKIREKTGMSPDSPENKIFLPTKAENHPTMSTHRGRHWQKVSDECNVELNKIVENGEAQRWMKEQFESELRSFLEKQRKMLSLGKIDLSNINRHSPSK